MFGWFKKKKKYPIETPSQKMQVLLDEFEDIDNNYLKLVWLANLILEARTSKGICYTALEFLNPQDYYRQAMEKLLDKE